MKKFLIIAFSFLLIILVSCKDQKNRKPMNNQELRETLIKANQLMAQKESEEINSYIAENNLKLTRSGSGLRYIIKEEGNLIRPDQDDTVIINYKMNLLDGTRLTENETDTIKFIMGRAETLRGLEEGLSMIGEGGNVFLIIPSHLAYGRTGNDIDVPGNSPVVVNATLVQVNKNNN